MSAPNPLFAQYTDESFQPGDAQEALGPFYFVFGAYFGMLIGVGLVAYRKKRATEAESKNKSLGGEDDAELRAHYGGTYHPCLIALTIFSSAFSGYTVVGVPQTTLERGYMVLMFFAGTCAQSIGMMWFFPRLRRIGMDRGYMSPGDFVADRYRHKGITVLCVIASSLPQFIYLAVQLASFGEALNGLTRGLIPKNIGIICCIAVMLTMEILGGMHSVVLTDIVQAIIMLFGFAMLAIVMVTQYNVFDLGVGCTEQRELLDAHTYTNCFTRQLWGGGKADASLSVKYGCLWGVDRANFAEGGMPISWPFEMPLREVSGAAEGQEIMGTLLVAGYFWFVTNFFVFSCNPHLVQRLFLAEKDSGLKSVAQLLIFSPFFAMGPGVLAGVLVASNWPLWGPGVAGALSDPDAGVACGTAFSTLAGVMVQDGGFNALLVIVLATAALAAIMSSADSVILGVSNMLCVDIYKNMVSRAASTPCIVFMGQVISVFMCFVCYFFAMQISGSTFMNWLAVQNGVLFQVAPAMYYGLHKDFSNKSIFRGIMAGFITLVPVLYLQLFGPASAKALFTLIAGPSFAAIVNILVVQCNKNCADSDEEETEYAAQLASRFGGRLTGDRINEIMQGTVEPNNSLLYIALVILIFTVPWYSSWTAKIGIMPGWALIVSVMTFLCTVVIFMAASTWKPKDNDDGSAETRHLTREMSNLGKSLHIEQTQAAY